MAYLQFGLVTSYAVVIGRKLEGLWYNERVAHAPWSGVMKTIVVVDVIVVAVTVSWYGLHTAHGALWVHLYISWFISYQKFLYWRENLIFLYSLAENVCILRTCMRLYHQIYNTNSNNKFIINNIIFLFSKLVWINYFHFLLRVMFL